MSNYKWKCQACETVNDSASTLCKKCSCPSECTAEDIEQWNINTGHREPIKPRIYNNTQGPLANVDKCPQCDQLMFIKDTKCPHCHHLLSSEESFLLKKNFFHARNKGVIWGFILIPFVILVLYFAFRNIT